jgi:hypothetical protein
MPPRPHAATETPEIILDLSLGQGVEIERAVMAVFEGLLEHEREEAAERVTADGRVKVMEVGRLCKQLLGRSDGLCARPGGAPAQPGSRR